MRSFLLLFGKEEWHRFTGDEVVLLLIQNFQVYRLCAGFDHPVPDKSWTPLLVRRGNGPEPDNKLSPNAKGSDFSFLSSCVRILVPSVIRFERLPELVSGSVTNQKLSVLIKR
ncbi:hypothetical protein [Sunxiuqinia rutila]|uniref:hypothetical protein n=1 Tax=Sunxiuqinia rutila TaxID=1397841 RepID=UPI003D35DFC5